MVESEHSEAEEEVKTIPVLGGGDVKSKKMELAGNRQREDSLEDVNHEPLLSKKQLSEANDRTSEADRDKTSRLTRKANGDSNALNNDHNLNTENKEEEEELSNENAKITSVKTHEKMDDVDSTGKNNGDKAHNDASIANEDAEQKSKSVDDKDSEENNAEKNATSSEGDEEVNDDGVSSSKAKSSEQKQPGRPSVSKSKTKDPEVVDGLEMSVECASDKEESGSDPENKEDKRKTRPIMIFLKAEPNEWELDTSTSEAEKWAKTEEREATKTKKATMKGAKGTLEGKERKRGKKKVALSGSDDSDDDTSQDEDYSPRTIKKMKKAFPAKNTSAKSPGKRRGRTPKKVPELSENELSEERKNDERKLKKPKEKALKKSAGSEEKEKRGDEIREAVQKNGKKYSIALSDDDRRIQALKKYLSMAGIRIKSYEQFWAGCKTNAARLAHMKETLALHGVVGRPTMDKCKKAKARLEFKKNVDPLGPVDNVEEENMDEEVPTTLSPITRNKKGQTVHRRERVLIVNLYKDLKVEKPGITKRAAHSILSKKTGFGIFSIKNTLLEYENTGTVTSPNMKKHRISGNQLVDEFDRNAIRRKFHQFVINKEVPTLQKLLDAVNDDEDLPNFKRTTFWKLSKELNLRFPST